MRLYAGVKTLVLPPHLSARVAVSTCPSRFRSHVRLVCARLVEMPQLQQYDFSPGVDRCAWSLLLSVTSGAVPCAVTVLFIDAMRVYISTL